MSRRCPDTKHTRGTAAEVVPALHGIQQEPAWPSIMAGHWPEHWQNSEPPPDRHRDLVSLLTEDGLNDETWQAIEGFYTFMLVSPTQ